MRNICFYGACVLIFLSVFIWEISTSFAHDYGNLSLTALFLVGFILCFINALNEYFNVEDYLGQSRLHHALQRLTGRLLYPAILSGVAGLVAVGIFGMIRGDTLPDNLIGSILFVFPPAFLIVCVRFRSSLSEFFEAVETRNYENLEGWRRTLAQVTEPALIILASLSTSDQSTHGASKGGMGFTGFSGGAFGGGGSSDHW